MRFLKAFLFNLGLLALAGILLLILFPDFMSQVYKLFGVMLGPVAILIVIVAALPRRRRY